MGESNTENIKSGKKRTILIVNILLVGCLGAGIIWGILTYFDLGNNAYTNDAQVEEYISPVNTRISGYIKEVRFQEHQHIKKGDTLLVIDDSEYKIQLELAQAAYLSAQASKNVSSSAVSTVESNVTVSDANINASKARLWNAEQNYRRYESLVKDGAATQQQFDQAKSEYNAIQAQTSALIQQRRTVGFSTRETSQKVTVNDAEIKKAHAAVSMAKLNLSYTVILAPYNGVTGRRTVQEGQLVQAGQTLLSFIRGNSKWVVANYKETQISKLRIGQKMDVSIDGLGSKKIRGTITAISQATGSRYSAVPIDNSTGNFIKVQQRIPVKIEFSVHENNAVLLSELRAGMNAEVTTAD